jgi:hypothetical protein
VLGQPAALAAESVWTPSLAVAFVALAVAVASFWRAGRKDKRDLFLRIHEALIEPDVVAGRRALYKIRDKGYAKVLIHQEAEQTSVYRALAMFDVLGLYAEEGWVDEETVLKEWGNSLRRSWAPASLFIEARYETIRWHSWPHYERLAKKALDRADDDRAGSDTG